jgi:hypothetical protein
MQCIHSRLAAVHRQRSAAVAAAEGDSFDRPLGKAAAVEGVGTFMAPQLAGPLERQLWLQDLARSCSLEELAARVPDGIPG